MSLELFDSYNIRVRLCSVILLLAPIVITIFSCFEEFASFTTSSILIGILLAFSNYVPILQRRFYKNRFDLKNYAAQFLYVEDPTIDFFSKIRFYNKLAKADSEFSIFLSPNNSEEFHKACESAVDFIKARTRNSHLVREENINYGFCKNLFVNKFLGIIVSIMSLSFVIAYSLIAYKSFSWIPLQNYIAMGGDLVFLIFWLFGINENILDDSAKKYARALIYAIDEIEI